MKKHWKQCWCLIFEQEQKKSNVQSKIVSTQQLTYVTTLNLPYSKPAPKKEGTSVGTLDATRLCAKKHHHLTTGKHKVSREDLPYREYLRETGFVELEETEEEPEIVLSSEDWTPSDGSKTVIDDEEQETENESSPEMSTDEKYASKS